MPNREFFQIRDAAVSTGTAKHNGAKYSHDNSPTQQTEKVERAGGNAKLMQFHRVLHDNGRCWVHRAHGYAKQAEQGAEICQRETGHLEGHERQRHDANHQANDGSPQIMRQPREQTSR